MGKLVLMRHGQSEWNLENRFTGFVDVDLSAQGVKEAEEAGRALKSKNITFDHVFTSTLKRAIRTGDIALEQAEQQHLQAVRHDDLRERDYGDLAGLNKAETAKKYGDAQVHEWRRSYDVRPPNGESLKDVVGRVGPYFNTHIKPQLDAGQNVLIVAHGNTLRALLIVLGLETPETINNAEIPTGQPIIHSWPL